MPGMSERSRRLGRSRTFDLVVFLGQCELRVGYALKEFDQINVAGSAGDVDRQTTAIIGSQRISATRDQQLSKLKMPEPGSTVQRCRSFGVESSDTVWVSSEVRANGLQ